MPSDKKYLQSLDACVRGMAASEKDKDVTFELRQSLTRLDKTETLTEGVSQCLKVTRYYYNMFDNDGFFFQSNMPTLEDLEDRKKFDEEVRFANIVPRPGASIAMNLDARRGEFIALQEEKKKLNVYSHLSTVVKLFLLQN